jgi:hypothetical protein
MQRHDGEGMAETQEVTGRERRRGKGAPEGVYTQHSTKPSPTEQTRVGVRGEARVGRRPCRVRSREAPEARRWLAPLGPCCGAGWAKGGEVLKPGEKRAVGGEANPLNVGSNGRSRKEERVWRIGMGRTGGYAPRGALMGQTTRPRVHTHPNDHSRAWRWWCTYAHRLSAAEESRALEGIRG